MEQMIREVHAILVKLSVKPADFNFGATVHHHLEPGGLGALRGGVVSHSLLHPDGLDAFFLGKRDRLVGNNAGRV